MIVTRKLFLVLPAAAVLTIAGILIATSIEAYGQQEEEQQESTAASPSPTGQTTEFQDTFNLEDCDFASHGSNRYFILEPGHQSVLQGQEDGETIDLVITVLNETNVVDGIETRVVEERESEDGELVEISRNYFAVCKPTNDVFYFGEDVDDYEDGEIVGHEGEWLAGENDARAGLFMPGNVQVGLKYYQEFAPGVAEDRAEIVSVNDTLAVPAGNFTEVLKVEESNPLEPDVGGEDNLYAPGIGVIQDEEVKLVEYTLP